MQTARGSDDDARYPDEFPVGKKVHQKEVYLYGLLYNEVVHTLHQAHFFTDTGGVGSSVFYKIVFQSSFVVFENA